MHPFGCFGSSLACAPQTSFCQACDKLPECEAITTARKPQLMLLLDKFTDTKGKPMSRAWMTTADKRALTQSRKDNKLRESRIRLYGSVAAAERIRTGLDKRAQLLFDRMTRDGLNIMQDSLSVLSRYDRQMATVIALLKVQPQSVKDMVAAVAAQMNLSEATAERDTYARVSILIVSDRAQRVGPIVELK